MYKSPSTSTLLVEGIPTWLSYYEGARQPMCVFTFTWGYTTLEGSWNVEDLGLRALGLVIPRMGTHMEKNMENKTETGIMQWLEWI